MAPNSAAANIATGAATVAALLGVPVTEAPALEPLRVPAAPLPEEPVAVAVAVAVAVGPPQSWVDANVWQLLEAGMDGVYGGVPTGPEMGWNQVVV